MSQFNPSLTFGLLTSSLDWVSRNRIWCTCSRHLLCTLWGRNLRVEWQLSCPLLQLLVVLHGHVCIRRLITRERVTLPLPECSFCSLFASLKQDTDTFIFYFFPSPFDLFPFSSWLTSSLTQDIFFSSRLFQLSTLTLAVQVLHFSLLVLGLLKYTQHRRLKKRDTFRSLFSPRTCVFRFFGSFFILCHVFTRNSFFLPA